MLARETREEPPEEGIGRVMLLTYVLSYDDLLADASVTLQPSAEARDISLGAAADGRGPGLRSPTELRVPDEWASRRHASIRRAAGGDMLSDQGSRNGTFVNGVRITGEQRLIDGDLIEIGHSLFCYRVVEEPLAAATDGDAPLLGGQTVTRCPEMALLVRDLARIAASSESVLLMGETGTGKEVAAQMVHALSRRAGAFVPVDCGAVPESLFESTFFGHRRGAFTGAAEARTGEIARADGGTLFLDEIGNTSLSSQAKLLRVLEDGRVTPLGASGAHEVDVRWISATNADLFQQDTPFRPDLLRRLAGYTARIPPLRRRREDLGTLTAWLLRQAGATSASITAAAARRLFPSPFPGNVRELRATLRSAAILAAGKPLGLQHLPDPEAPPRAPPASPGEPGPRAAPRLDPAEPTPAGQSGKPDAQAIEAVLAETGGNVVKAAARLSTHPRQLYRWMERFGISLDRFRGE